jgi:pyridoxine 4-dehydrogenase
MSLWSTDILENDIAKTCAELNIPVVAYSPLGRGVLTGAVNSLTDIPEGDFRRHMSRFQEENFQHNLKLIKEVQSLASRKGVAPAQIALAWVRSLSGKPGMPGAAARIHTGMVAEQFLFGKSCDVPILLGRTLTAP